MCPKKGFLLPGLILEGRKPFPRRMRGIQRGFEKFLKTVRSHCEEDSEVLMAMESTGCYHINLSSFLTSQGIRTMVVNPLLIANYAKLSSRKTMTDKKDAMTIVRFLLDHHKEISQLSISQDIQDLRDLSREKESLSHLVSATKVEIKRVLRTTFPEIETIGDIYTGVMFRLIQEYPSARLVRAAKKKGIAKLLKQPYVGNKLTFTAEDIVKVAQSSLATVSPAKEIILRGKIGTLLHLQERLAEVTKLLIDSCKSTKVGDLEILRSINGVRPNTAAPFLAEMGEVNNYTSYKKLIAYEGIGPSVRQSGKFIGMSKLSKRGNRHLRRTIYLMTASVVSQSPFFRAYFLKGKREGLAPQKAIFATAHKLIRVIFAMLSQRTRFNVKEAL